MRNFKSDTPPISKREVSSIFFGGKPIRSIIFEEKRYFLGIDCARSLGYISPSRAVQDHTPNSIRLFVHLDVPRWVTFIDRENFLKFIDNCSMPYNEKIREDLLNFRG